METENNIVANNEVTNSQKKKGKGSLVVIILLVIALLGACAYIAYDKFFKEEKIVDDGNNKKENKEEKTDVNLIKELSYGNFLISYNTFNPYKQCEHNENAEYSCKATIYFNEVDKKENEKFNIEYKVPKSADEEFYLKINNNELDVGYLDVKDIAIVKVFKTKNNYEDVEYQYLVNTEDSSGGEIYIYDVNGKLVKDLVNYATYYDNYKSITLWDNHTYYSYLLFYKCNHGLLSQYAYNFNNSKEIKLNQLSKVMCSAQED